MRLPGLVCPLLAKLGLAAAITYEDAERLSSQADINAGVCDASLGDCTRGSSMIQRKSGLLDNVISDMTEDVARSSLSGGDAEEAGSDVMAARRRSSSNDLSKRVEELEKNEGLRKRVKDLEDEVGELESAPGKTGPPGPPGPPGAPGTGGGGGGNGPPPAPSPRPSPSPSPTPPTPAPTAESGTTGSVGTPQKVPDSIPDRWLNAHNYWRCLHGSPPIKWDTDFAKGAQEWANRGQMSHAKCYKIPPPQGPAGENLASGSVMSPEKASSMWHDESPEKGPRCGGHCTAMLWSSAYKLGCGIHGSLYVCRYGGKSLREGTPNFGSRDAYTANIGFPDDSKEESCKKEWPQSEKGDTNTGDKGGGGGSGGRGGKGGGRSPFGGRGFR